MARRMIHCCLDIRGGMMNAKMLKGVITVDEHTLNTVREIRSFLQGQLDMGRRVLPMGNCDNFDYQRGCLGHDVEDAEEALSQQAENVKDWIPVVHGHWFSLTDCSNAGVYCSVCHKKVWKEDYAWCNRKNKLRSNYCPNCGAKMDMEVKDA